MQTQVLISDFPFAQMSGPDLSRLPRTPPTLGRPLYFSLEIFDKLPDGIVYREKILLMESQCTLIINIFFTFDKGIFSSEAAQKETKISHIFERNMEISIKIWQ